MERLHPNGAAHIVDQYVYAAESCAGFRHQRFGPLIGAEIDDRFHRFDTVFQQFFCRTRCGFVYPVRDDDFTAFLAKLPRGRAAYPLARARDHAHLVLHSASAGGAGVEFVGHRFLFLFI